MTLEAMDKLDPKFYPSISKNLNICLFGAGPLPEIIGLIEFLNSHSPSLNYLNIRAYDIAADSWSISHRIVKDFILPRVWSGAIKLESINFDLCEQNAFLELNTTIESSHVFIFQNCLNELSARRALMHNLFLLVGMLPSNSLLIINDLSNYIAVQKVKDQLENYVAALNTALSDIHQSSVFLIRSPRLGRTDFSTRLQIPIEIRTHLLTGEDGLIPRRNVKCNFIAIHRLMVPELEIEESHPFSTKNQSQADLLPGEIELFSKLNDGYNNLQERIDQSEKGYKLMQSQSMELKSNLETTLERLKNLEQQFKKLKSVFLFFSILFISCIAVIVIHFLL